MFSNPRVIGRHLDGEVERKLEPVFAGRVLEMPEVVKRPKLWRDGIVPARRAADGVRATGIVGSGNQAVIGALAVGDSDWVDRRHVHGVETHLGNGRETQLRFAEGRAAR